MKLIDRARRAARFWRLGWSASAAETRDELMKEIGWSSERKTKAGVMIGAESAMQLTAVNACVRVLAETIASLPLKLYRQKPDGGREVDDGHPLHRVLHERPNSWQTSFEWREEKMAHVLLRGHGYDFKNVVRGKVVELIPIHPDRVTPYMLTSGEMRYRVLPDRNSIIARDVVTDFTAEEIFHISGLRGRSVIADAREALGLTAAQEQFAAKLYANGAQFSCVASHPTALTDKARENMRKSWQETYGGSDKAFQLLILEEGVKYEKISMSAQDAQFLESRRFQIAEIARMFRVPLHMLGELDRSTNNNIEQQAREFVMLTMLPWMVRWEQAISRDLIGEPDRFAKFSADALLRGDPQARATFYRYGRQDGWLSPNEVRAREEMNPREGGETYDPPNMPKSGPEADAPATRPQEATR